MENWFCTSALWLYPASDRREQNHPVYNNEPTFSVQVAPQVGWVIYYSNLLGTSFDIHEMIARSSFLFSASLPFYLSRSYRALMLWQRLPMSHCESQSIPISMVDIGHLFLWTHDKAHYLGFSVDCGRWPQSTFLFPFYVIKSFQFKG